MKRLPFNTITVLWGIVIFLASCAFTTKTQKAQSEPVHQEQKNTPTLEFLAKVKASKTYLKKGGEYYDFRTVDFENYEKPTFENLFTTYADLFDLSEHDEMKPLHDIKYRKPRTSSLNYSLFGGSFSEVQYQHFHKGFPVILKGGDFYKIPVQGDSIGKYVWKVYGGILSKLDIDTTVTVSSKEAFSIAKSSIPINEDEIFIFEQSKTEIPEAQKTVQSLSDVKLKIYDGRLAYSYVFVVRNPTSPYNTYEAFVDTKTAELLHLKKPLNANHLSTPIAEKTSTIENCNLFVESEVEYTVENPTLSGVNNEFLEFDIDVASMVNNEGFYSGEILIDYNSLTFGTNLASSGRITLTKGTVITAPNYTLSVVDVSPDQMKITAQSTTSNPSNYYMITNQSEELAHIKIDISNLAGNTGIEFDEIQMQGLSELFDAAASSHTPFDLVTASDELNIDINGIITNLNSCTTCPGGVFTQVGNPCATIACTCPTAAYTDIFEFAGTHYYECKEIPFKDCDATENILLWANRPNENIQLFYGDNTTPVTIPIEWCEINNEIALTENQIIEANAMYSIETTNSYFNSVFGINSFDNLGTQQRVEIYDNSTQSSNQPYPINNPNERVLNLGRGVLNVCGPMVSLDIVSHEFTHGVLSQYIKMGQNDVTGNALQESITDIFSTIIRHDESGGLQTWGGHSIWGIGQEACTNYPTLPRLFNNPLGSTPAQAAYYQDPAQGWDNDPTHLDLVRAYNHAGVTTLWFYRLSQGSGGVNALGVDGAEAILVRALELMQQNAFNNGNVVQNYTFENFRDYTIDAVIDLHGVCSNQHESVVNSWISVGLLKCTNIDVAFEEVTVQPNNNCDKILTANVLNSSGCFTVE